MRPKPPDLSDTQLFGRSIFQQKEENNYIPVVILHFCFL